MVHLSWLEIAAQSWPVLSTLLLCSIISVAVILQKVVYFRKVRKSLNNIKAKIESKTDKNFVQNTIAETPVKEFSRIFTDTQSNTERRLQEFTFFSKKGLWVLGTLGTASPFIGLLGTVIGIIKSFRSMAVEGSGGFAVVASGISEALIATAGGLLVAITSSVFFNYFTVRIKELNQESKFVRDELKDQYGI